MKRGLVYFVVTSLLVVSLFAFSVDAKPNRIGLNNAEGLRADFAIYAGSGTWEPSILAFENFLEWKGLTYERIDKNTLNRGNLAGNYNGLFMPGGWAGDYNRDIKNSGDQEIREFIASGGAYIGMSAGAFYACDVTIWEGDHLDYPSDLFNGDCIGPIEEIAPWPEYTMTTMDINNALPQNTYEPDTRDVLYYGEPYFIAHPGQEFQTFASWIVPTDPVADDKPGIIGFDYGNGRVLLVGPHPEIEEDSVRDGNDFGEELSDGPDGSDWPFLWTAVDWILNEPISQPPGAALPQCSNGLDDDNDGLIDLIDGGCENANDNDEIDEVIILVECEDGLDNDNDSFIDFADPGCTDSSDDDETDVTIPVELFFDDFNSGLGNWNLQTVENNWRAVSNYAEAQPRNTNEPASTMEIIIDASGFNSFELDYDRRLVGLDVGDEFKALWFDGNSWQVLEQTGSDGENNANFVSKSYSLNGNGNVRLKFECTAGAVSEYCRVDNVRVVGD